MQQTIDIRGGLRWGWLVLRFRGPIAAIVSGVVHLQQFFGPYRDIPTIGPPFIGDFVAATVIGAAPARPTDRPR
jgi:hypothetical protein